RRTARAGARTDRARAPGWRRRGAACCPGTGSGGARRARPGSGREERRAGAARARGLLGAPVVGARAARGAGQLEAEVERGRPLDPVDAEDHAVLLLAVRPLDGQVLSVDLVGEQLEGAA